MPMLSRLLSRYWLLIPLLIAVVVLIDLVEEPAPFVVEETLNMRETRSDYYLSEFRSRKFDRDGRIEYTVTGDTLAHYPHNDRSEIAAPRLELQREDALWQVASSNGRFDPDPDLFTLFGDVVVTRHTEDGEPITMRTPSLTIATESNEVRTDEPVEIRAATWQLQATGLTSSIDHGKLTLLSDVTGRYEVISQ